MKNIKYIKKTNHFCFDLYTNIILYAIIILFFPKAITATEVSLDQSRTNILLDKANKYYFSGDYNAAISTWLKIIESPNQKSEQIAVVYANLASLNWKTGNSENAIKYWQQSLEIYRELEPRNSDQKIAATLIDTARAYNDLGQPHFSIPLVTEAIAVIKDKKVTKAEDMAYLTLGNAYSIQGLYELAINAYESSLKNIERTNDELLIIVWNNLSKAYQEQMLITRNKAISAQNEEDLLEDELWQQVDRNFSKAWQAAKKATNIGEDNQSIARVEALLQLAKLAKEKGKSSDVTNTLLEAETVLDGLPDSYQKVYALITLNKLSENYSSKSNSVLDLALETAKKINNSRVTSFALGAMGRHFEERQQYALALYWTNQAQVAAHQSHARDSLYQWDWQAARIYRKTGATKQAIESYEQAITSLQSIRISTNQLQGNSLSKFQNDIEPIYRGFIELLLSSNSDVQSLKAALQAKDLLLLNELEVFFRDNCFELETYSEIDKISYLKKTNTAIVNTIVLNDRSYIIWQLPNGEFKKYAINISQKQFDELIKQWRFNLENKENDNYLALSQQLYKLLFSQHIQSYLDNSNLENLIFVNDGILRNVPMTALHNGDKFLVEDYAISNSLGLNLKIRQSQPKIEKALAFGLTTSVNQFPPLPFVKEEIESLNGIFNKKDFVDAKFTKQNFKQQISENKSSLIHIATHGKFGESIENTFLQAYQSQINLTELEETLIDHNINFPNNPILLLVLSACDTAANNPRATLGMSGVAARSGVHNTLGSLWSVNDQQLVTLINDFYSSWIKEKMSLTEALRHAQLKLINSPNYHPSNWSSMILLQN